MLTIALFIGFAILFYYLKLDLKGEDINLLGNKMDQAEQVHCSSSESDNFEKIDSEEVQREGSKDPHFILGDEGSDVPQDFEGPAHEGGDLFPNAPPPSIRPKLTLAQQLALAEKRSKLR